MSSDSRQLLLSSFKARNVLYEDLFGHFKYSLPKGNIAPEPPEPGSGNTAPAMPELALVFVEDVTAEFCPRLNAGVVADRKFDAWNAKLIGDTLPHATETRPRTSRRDLGSKTEARHARYL